MIKNCFLIYADFMHFNEFERSTVSDRDRAYADQKKRFIFN